jgi:glycosyltransferase involved in cell wall biosynthesis
VLFVSHEATRTGAPLVLLHLLRWLRDHTDLSFEVLLLAGGPLADEFAEVAPTTAVEALGRSGTSYLEAGMARAGFAGASDRLKVIRGRRMARHLEGFDALYLNSATSALALRMLPVVPPMVISHIHELRSALIHWFPEPDRSNLLQATDWYVACSAVVQQTLIDDLGVPADRVSCHHEFIIPPTPNPSGAATVREALGIAPTATVIGGSGTITWRKGPDLFVQAAAHLHRRRPDLDVHFVWVGGAEDDRMPLDRDLAKLGLTDRVHFLGELARPDEAFGTYDVFCLTSREDPYPLVMLEAASLGVPVVSFDNGGARELAGADPSPDVRRAAVVPYLDLEALVAELIELIDDPDARRGLGRRGRDHVLANHVVEVGAPALAADLLAHLQVATPATAGPEALEGGSRPSAPMRTSVGGPLGVTAP